MPYQVKQYGLRRTGTNFLQWLLETNYGICFQHNWTSFNVDGRRLRLGIDRKHGFPKTDEFPIIINTRHPLSWLVAVYEYYEIHRKGINFHEFMTLPDVHLPALNCHGQDLIERWNRAHYCYWRWMPKGTPHTGKGIIRFEELVRDPRQACSGLVAKLWTTRPQLADAGFKLPKGKEEYCGPRSQYRLPGVPARTPQWELEKEFMQFYTPELVEFVRGEISPKIFQSMGYSWEGYEQ